MHTLLLVEFLNNTLPCMKTIPVDQHRFDKVIHRPTCITTYFTICDDQWNKLSNFNIACSISSGFRLRERRLALISLLDHPWNCSKFILTNAQPSETFSISMEILPLRELFHPFAFQVVGRGKRNFFEGVMVFFLNAFLKACERCFFTSLRILIEVELFSRKFSNRTTMKRA